ncbi:MAG: exonuclease SbcCD subunit D [Paludibacteraceae bacterium]|nr:exonuclease SbcCD subunit D [Paludibacteraceae bacterium]
MKIIHTADLHLGQLIYQNYDRVDEHRHFFRQLEKWCIDEQPDALIVSGDVFDIQQPSAATRKFFTDAFVSIRRVCPSMHIVITAGNHDSASRIQADSSIWEIAETTLIGTPPSALAERDVLEKYIVRLENGYIIAIPYYSSSSNNQIQAMLDIIDEENKSLKPVVVMGHVAVTGSDVTGHNFEIGTLRTTDVEYFGKGADYVALGHIHKPQTIGHQEDCMKEEAHYPTPVIRYSGSALHVSCDEQYPHTVSLVEIDRHGGEVNIRQLRIDELLHFHVLPNNGSSFTDADEAVAEVQRLAADGYSGYFRLRMSYSTYLPADFNQRIYEIKEVAEGTLRYNPKIEWTGKMVNEEEAKPTFEVAELQQMTDPMQFIAKTIDSYEGLEADEIREMFDEVKRVLYE